MSYFDIDEILMEDCLIPCSSKIACKNLAFLCPDLLLAAANSTGNETTTSGKNSSSVDYLDNKHELPKGSKFELPLWAALPLAFPKVQKTSTISAHLPKHYGDNFRKKCLAGAEGFNLRLKSLFFFEVGNRLCEAVANVQNLRRDRGRGDNSAKEMSYLVKECKELRQTLLATFAGERLRRIYDKSLNSVDLDVSKFLRILSDMECKFFYICRNSKIKEKDWKIYGSNKIAVSEVGKQMVQRNVVQSVSTSDNNNTEADKSSGEKRVEEQNNNTNGKRAKL